jgi:DNA invertase Pin-like site-specific DNA recombinase
MSEDTPTPRRAIVYTRVSTGAQAESGLGLTDQLDRITATLTSRGWEVVHHAQDAGLSGKRADNRPALVEALRMLDAGEADVLVASKLDRLSRSVIDFAAMVQRAKRKGWAIVVLDSDVDTTTAAGRLFVNVMVSMAEFESDRIAERVAASHQVRRARGQRAGQRPELPEAIRTRIADEVTDGRALRAIAQDLNAESVPTARGGIWHASTVRHVARSVALEAELATIRATVAA